MTEKAANIDTVLTRFVLHPRTVPHYSTILKVLSLLLEIVLIVLHPRIVLHHLKKQTISLVFS